VVLERRGGDTAVVVAVDLIGAANELNGKIKIVDEIDESLLHEFA
jgi:predicted RNA-binding protein